MEAGLKSVFTKINAARVVLLLLLFPGVLNASGDGPRVHGSAPVGANMLVFHATTLDDANRSFDPSIVTPLLRFDTSIGTIQYARTMELDGRFSGTNKGCAVAHISPEAAVGGPLALVEDGDEVEIDIPAARIDLLIDDDEMARRREAWSRPQPRVKKGYLSIYSKMADSTARGASLKYR